MTKFTYTCDLCNTESDQADFLSTVDIRVVKHSRRIVTATKDLCPKCLKQFVQIHDRYQEFGLKPEKAETVELIENKSRVDGHDGV